jgi:sugar phosphate isomerase/epimerase
MGSAPAMTFDAVLAAVAAAGYAGIETFGPLEPPAAEMAALLEKHNLQAVSAHVGLGMLEYDLEGVAAYHKTLGNDTLVVPWLDVQDRPSSAVEWTELGAKLDALGARARDLGMRLLYHNHDFEMVDVDGRTALEWLLDGAAPENVGAEVDIAWVVRGDQEPLRLIAELAGRLPRLHVKDVATEGENADEGGHADVGAGILDWTTLLPAAQQAGVEWLVVEHDEPADPIGSIQRSAAFLRDRWPAVA